MKLEKIISKRAKNIIMKTAWPIITNVSHLFDLDDKYSEIDQDDWNFLSENLREGDVFLSTGYNILSSMFLPGKYKHSAIVVSAEKDNPMLVEALPSGVRATPLFDFLKKKKMAMLFRSNCFSDKVASLAAQKAFEKIGTPYDYLWSPDNSWLYCSELVYESYKRAYFKIYGEIKPASFILKMKVRCGEPTYIPDDIRNSPKHWEALWSNSNLINWRQ